MNVRNEDSAVPPVAGQRNDIGLIAQRFGGDADVDFSGARLLRDLDGVALVQHEPHFRKARRKSGQNGRKHVAGLRMRRRDAEQSRIFEAV